MARKNRLRKKKAKLARRAKGQSLMLTEFPEDALFVESPPDQNMSEVLQDFIDPYLEQCDDYEHNLRALLAVGIVAWNAALMSTTEATTLIDSTVATMPAQIREDGRNLLHELIGRKWLHFAHNQRMILDYSVTMRPEGPYVQVISTLQNVGSGPSWLGTAARAMIAFFRWVSRGVRRIRGG